MVGRRSCDGPPTLPDLVPSWPAQKRRNSDDRLGYSYGEIVPWVNLGLELELPTDPVSVEAMTGRLNARPRQALAPHRPRVGGSHDWPAKRVLATQSWLPPTRGRWGAGFLSVSRLSCSVTTSTDTGSVGKTVPHTGTNSASVAAGHVARFCVRHTQRATTPGQQRCAV